MPVAHLLKERALAERAPNTKERVLDGLFVGSPVPMLLVDARSRRITRANAALGALLGRAPDSMAGQYLRDLEGTTPADEEEYLLLALACRDQRPRRRVWLAADGSDVPVEVQAARLHGDQGTLLALYARDARPEEQAEKVRNALHSQLMMAQKHEAVGRLATGVAHDFNNLLSTVMLTAELIRGRLDMDEETRTDLDLITGAGIRARNLTRELLAFTGRQDLRPRPLSLNQVLNGMQALIRRTLPANIELVMRLCDGPAAISADPTQMEQVFVNLMVNARDAMSDGGYLVVTTQEVELDEAFAQEYVSVKPGPHVMLSVTDTGEGMDEQTRSRIFEPFFTTRERGTGGGLGLATVYGIVKQSGGNIWVTSQPGVGTTFRVYFPRLPGLEPEPKDDFTDENETEGRIPRGTEHVLVVEDDDAVRGGIVKILRGLGYQITEAASPTEALKIHEDLWPSRGPHPVDLLLTDVVMPGMTGVELVRRLRMKREDLRVLYVSGYLDPMAEASSLEHLAKPFTRAELGQHVRAFLDQ